MEVMFWTSIGVPVHYIYHNITLFHAFNIDADNHASILLSCIMTSSLQQFFKGYNVPNDMTLSNQIYLTFAAYSAFDFFSKFLFVFCFFVFCFIKHCLHALNNGMLTGWRETICWLESG